MSKALRFRIPFDSHRVKRSQTLLKSVRQYFYHIVSSLWAKLSLKMSLWMTFDILGLFVNILSADDYILFAIKKIYRNQLESAVDKYSLWRGNLIGRIYHNQFESHYGRIKEIFLHFLILFWNLHRILNIWKKEDEIHSWPISEIRHSQRRC